MTNLHTTSSLVAALIDKHSFSAILILCPQRVFVSVLSDQSGDTKHTISVLNCAIGRLFICLQVHSLMLFNPSKNTEYWLCW